MRVNRRQQILTAVDSWYARHARVLPWRIGPAARDEGLRPDPYLVWLSEIMLQQTTVAHAAPYFERFKASWPNVNALAGAHWDEVSAAWAGLGYYSRARNLHLCAKALAERGGFPQERDDLLSLPGIGPYTAAAIAAIAFDEPAAPVDGNIERVVSRLFAIGPEGKPDEPSWRADKKRIGLEADALFKAAAAGHRPGDIAQGLMDLGAAICTPRAPACAICPLSASCEARKLGAPERWPMKPAKADRPSRFGSAFVAVKADQVLLVRRPPKGLLGGMLMPPTSEWSHEPPKDALADAPLKLTWESVGEVRHVFTHFALRLEVWRGQAPKAQAKQGAVWIKRDEALASLPTVGRKAVALALGGGPRR